MSFVDSLSDDQKEALFFLEQAVLDSNPDKFNQIFNLNAKQNKRKCLILLLSVCKPKERLK